MTNAPTCSRRAATVSVRQCHPARPWIQALSDVFTMQGMGRSHRAGQHWRARRDPRGSRTPSRLQPPERCQAWKDGYFDDEVVTVQIPAAQQRPDRVQGPTRASARTPRPNRWPACARPSPRTARSPPAPPRRSPTGPAPSSSKKSKAQELGLDWLAGDRRPRRRRRSRLDSAEPARRGEGEGGAVPRRASRPPTSTWSRSTRPSLRSASSRRANWACRRTRSTPTVAPSPWGTRSACPERASR